MTTIGGEPFSRAEFLMQGYDVYSLKTIPDTELVQDVHTWDGMQGLAVYPEI